MALARPLLAAEQGEVEAGIPRSVFYAVINFAILVGILVYFLKKPTKEFFASRATLIRTTITQAQELKSNAERKYAEYERRLQSIDAERQELIASLKKDGELERGRIIQTAQEQVSSLKTTSEKIMAQELRKAKEELKRDAVILAAELAEKLIQENITPQDQGRIVEQYLEKMEKLG
jgi:F-type H+-transporting ATPase subunit b